MGTNLMSEREVYSAARTLTLMDEYCRENGMKFALAPIPNKNTLYPEKMPGFYRGFSGRTNMDMLKAALGDIGYIDIKEAFEDEKVLYRRTDSHWTTEGAGLACDVILDALGKAHTDVYGTKTAKKDNGAGDLYDMLYVWGRNYDKDTVYVKEHKFSYERPVRSFEDNFINTVCEGKADRLYMFRDSFGNTLHPFLADEFAHCTFTRILPFNLIEARKDNADFVILETVERNIERIITDGAVFEAPQRSLKGDVTDITGDTELEISDASSIIDGYIRLDGNIGVPPGTCDNIIVVSEGVSFEATPKGDSGFYAYIPKPEENKFSIYLMR